MLVGRCLRNQRYLLAKCVPGTRPGHCNPVPPENSVAAFAVGITQRAAQLSRRSRTANLLQHCEPANSTQNVSVLLAQAAQVIFVRKRATSSNPSHWNGHDAGHIELHRSDHSCAPVKRDTTAEALWKQSADVPPNRLHGHAPACRKLPNTDSSAGRAPVRSVAPPANARQPSNLRWPNGHPT